MALRFRDMSIPGSLPLKYAEYRDWTRNRDGLARYLKEHIEFNRSASEDFASLDRLARKVRERLVHTGVQRATTTQRNRLSSFLAERADLDVETLEALLHELGLATAMKYNQLPPPSLDFFRSAWLSESNSKSSKERPRRIKLGNDLRMYRMIDYPQRLIDAYRCEVTCAYKKSRYFAHIGDEYMYVWGGNVGIEFLGLKKEPLGQGDSILFDSSHPHRVWRISPKPATVLCVIADPTGIGSEMLRKQYSGMIPSDSSMTSAVRTRVAIALSSSHHRLRCLAAMLGIGERRLRQLQSGTETPKPEDVRRLASIFRLPESHFYTPFSPETAHRTYRIIRSGDMELMFEGKQFNPSGYMSRRSHLEEFRRGEWIMSPIEPPEIPGQAREQRLIPCPFFVNERTRHESRIEFHHQDDPGEELVIVLDGCLGFKCLPPSADQPHDQDSVGTFESGDAIWYTSELGHTFFAPGGPAKSLFFRWLHPSFARSMSVEFSGKHTRELARPPTHPA